MEEIGEKIRGNERGKVRDRACKEVWLGDVFPSMLGLPFNS